MPGPSFKTEFRKVAKTFLDRNAVIKSLDEIARKALLRIGGTIRTIASRSIRPAGKKGKSSSPGKPPRTATKILPKSIFFGFDIRKRELFTGPVKLKSAGKWKATRDEGNSPEPATGASVMEYGGTLEALEGALLLSDTQGRSKKGQFTAKKPRLRQVPKGTTITIKARPYMRPALEKAVRLKKLEKAFAAIA